MKNCHSLVGVKKKFCQCKKSFANVKYCVCQCKKAVHLCANLLCQFLLPHDWKHGLGEWIVNVLPTPVFYLNHYFVVLWEAPYSILCMYNLCCKVFVIVVFWVGKPIVNVWRITGRRWAITGLSYDVCMVFVLSGVCVVYGICNVILSMVCAMCVPHCVAYV